MGANFTLQSMEMMSELLWFCKGGIGGSGASTLHALCPNCVTEQGQPQGSPCQGSSAGLSAYQERGAGQVLLGWCVAVVGVIPPNVAGCVLLWEKEMEMCWCHLIASWWERWT